MSRKTHSHPPRGLAVWGGRLLLVLASSLVVVLVLELGLRLQDARLEATRESTMVPLPPDLPRIGTMTQLAGSEVDGVFAGRRYRTNSRGFRSPELAPIPAPGVFRIAITGDSVTAGHGVDAEEAYPGLLAERLEARFPDRRFEVLNLGLPGANAVSAIWRLQRASRHYGLHMTVYGWTINDLEGPHYLEVDQDDTAKIYYLRLGMYKDSPSALVRWFWPHWVSTSERLFPTMNDRWGRYRINYEDNPEAWAEFENALEAFQRFNALRGICGVMLQHTRLVQLDNTHPLEPWYGQVAGAARMRGIPVIPTLPGFLGRAPWDLWVSYLDSHPNADAHEILVEQLVDGLARLPESCWNARLAPPTGRDESDSSR